MPCMHTQLFFQFYLLLSLRTYTITILTKLIYIIFIIIFDTVTQYLLQNLYTHILIIYKKNERREGWFISRVSRKVQNSATSQPLPLSLSFRFDLFCFFFLPSIRFRFDYFLHHPSPFFFFF